MKQETPLKMDRLTAADRGIAAMQSINIAVQSLLCLLLFIGRGFCASYSYPESEEGHTIWRKFVPVWMVWNRVRTVACFVASVSFVAGLLKM